MARGGGRITLLSWANLMKYCTVPILIRGYLNEENLEHAWREIERTVLRSSQVEVLLVIAAGDGDIPATLNFLRRLATLKAPTAAKIYWTGRQGALIALKTARRQMVSTGYFSISVGRVDIEASEFEEDGRLKPDSHRMIQEFVAEMSAAVRFIRFGSSTFYAGGEVRLSAAECLAAGIVERIIY